MMEWLKSMPPAPGASAALKAVGREHKKPLAQKCAKGVWQVGAFPSSQPLCCSLVSTFQIPCQQPHKLCVREGLRIVWKPILHLLPRKAGDDIGAVPQLAEQPLGAVLI